MATIGMDSMVVARSDWVWVWVLLWFWLWVTGNIDLIRCCGDWEYNSDSLLWEYSSNFLVFTLLWTMIFSLYPTPILSQIGFGFGFWFWFCFDFFVLGSGASTGSWWWRWRVVVVVVEMGSLQVGGGGAFGFCLGICWFLV